MYKVLIVDDNQKILNRAGAYLFKYRDEFEVFTAEDGARAMAVLEKTEIDLLITDLVMPRVDGFTLLAHINEHYPRILCIAMTGYASENIENMLPDNLLLFVRKPFTLYELLDIIRKSLKKKPPAGSVRGISLPSFMKLIEMEEKSCALDVDLPGQKTGRFLFLEGKLHDAQFEDFTGEEAALQIILNGERASFTLNPLPKQRIPQRINMGVMELILKSSRIRDMWTSEEK
ncbi:MAG: response regulator [Desulfosudaceae bacterium]